MGGIEGCGGGGEEDASRWQLELAVRSKRVGSDWERGGGEADCVLDVLRTMWRMRNN